MYVGCPSLSFELSLVRNKLRSKISFEIKKIKKIEFMYYDIFKMPVNNAIFL